MRCIEDYKRLEDDQQQNKGKMPTATPNSKESRQGGFQLRSSGGLRIQEPSDRAREVNVLFKELVHKILEQIKNGPYFQWPSKMGGDPSRRNQNLYCTYHWDKGHITE